MTRCQPDAAGHRHMTALPAAVAIGLGVAALTVAAARRPQVARCIAFGGSAIASMVTGFAALAVLLGSAPAQGVLLTHTASGSALGYTLDPLSAWFLLVLCLLAVPIAVYSIGYRRLPGAGHLRRPASRGHPEPLFLIVGVTPCVR